MTRKTRLYLGVIVVNALYWVPGCFRESPPCDAATLERIQATCANEVDCLRQIDERETLCEARMRRGE